MCHFHVHLQRVHTLQHFIANGAWHLTVTMRVHVRAQIALVDEPFLTDVAHKRPLHAVLDNFMTCQTCIVGKVYATLIAGIGPCAIMTITQMDK